MRSERTKQLTDQLAEVIGGSENATKTVDFALAFKKKLERLCTDELDTWKGELDATILLLVQMNAMSATADQMKKIMVDAHGVDFEISEEDKIEILKKFGGLKDEK